MWASWLPKVSKVEGGEPVGLKSLGMHQPPLPAGRWVRQLFTELYMENGQQLADREGEPKQCWWFLWSLDSMRLGWQDCGLFLFLSLYTSFHFPACL